MTVPLNPVWSIAKSLNLPTTGVLVSLPVLRASAAAEKAEEHRVTASVCSPATVARVGAEVEGESGGGGLP